MIHLIYISRVREDFTALDLKKLLLGARLRNAAVGVTGMLVYYGGRFLQLLEGEEHAVKATFARIEGDQRHDEICVLCSGEEVRARMFAQWSMGFADGSGVARVLKGFVGLEHDPNLAMLNKTHALGLLLALSRDDLQQSA